jgi:hypothetical protein
MVGTTQLTHHHKELCIGQHALCMLENDECSFKRLQMESQTEQQEPQQRTNVLGSPMQMRLFHYTGLQGERFSSIPAAVRSSN